ncbi:MAG TPA: hypothetical protein VNZ45_02225, partial [Bacteroidia bacterium]|nr:hypothetical protein [Bacteroidia bacterium]
MKKIQIAAAVLLALGLSSIGFSQQAVPGSSATQQSSVPQAIKYQAVARTANGEIIANQNVSFRISILQGSAEGSTVYQEIQAATTNQFGLANISIGMGTPVTGEFGTIEWGKASYFAKIEFDPKGGAEYAYMGTSQLLSVPYSLYSEHAKIADNIPTFPKKVALQATNLQAPFDSPETGTLVYNTSIAGNVPYDVVPGYYYNGGTATDPNWVLLSSSDNSHQNRKPMACFTYQYGNCAGNGTTTAANNTGYGDNALLSITSSSGYDNTAIGYNALQANTTNISNTAVGSGALYSQNAANSETAIGYQAMYNNTSGEYNTALGYSALYTNGSGNYNTASGFEALYSNTGSANTALGYLALNKNSGG